MEVTQEDLFLEASQSFVGQWNRLVSSTNWEKGRIISNWRSDLKRADAPPAEFSDEAWSRRVGGVSPQHVGRLRRVHDRFGNVREQYEGLYWSHFQAALEFEDAEMWLEGAVQNGWSVSKMRHARWEALGAPENLKPRDEDVISVELDEDGLAPAGDAVPLAAELAEVLDPDAQADATDAPSDDESDRGGSARDEGGDEKGSVSDDAKPDVPRLRPFKDLPELPDDLTDAVESMQLAILHHKQDEWREVAVDDLLLTLDALKKLAVSPA